MKFWRKGSASRGISLLGPGLAAFSIPGVGPVTRFTSTMIFPLPGSGFVRRKRLAGGVAPVQGMPMGDHVLSRLPAQEDETVADEAVEVHQPLVEILHDHAARVDRLDLFFDLARQVTGPGLRALTSLDVRIVRHGTRAHDQRQ